MTYKLFIDDEREPANCEFIVARSSAEAIDILSKRGMPSEIAFDHDLGGDDTSMLIAHWMSEQIMDGTLSFPRGFSFSVHSQNPIGARNVTGLLEALLQHFPAR